ncbi:MAG: hypothetical protein Q8876_06485 [Bacillota bacterium]|nr:hypothetical protein [Bacillota bacterium]
MKKNKIRWYIFLLVFFTLLVSCKDNMKYQTGRDTEYAFGDGTYQIYRSSINTFPLKNNNNQETIERDVYLYRDISPYAYVVGQWDYTVLNYENGKIIQKTNLEDLPKKDQEIFNQKDKFTKP